MFQRILAACTGSICHSLVAEAMLRRLLPDRQLATTGLGALVGQGVANQVCVLAEDDGQDVSAHRARQLTPEMLATQDLVLVMSERQHYIVGELAPKLMGKTLCSFDGWTAAGGITFPTPTVRATMSLSICAWIVGRSDINMATRL